MHSIVKVSILSALLASCSHSSSSDDGNSGQAPQGPQAPQAPQDTEVAQVPDGAVIYKEIPAGEVEVFKFNSKSSFSRGDVACTKSGYGYALNDQLNKMAVCCVAFNETGLSEGTVKFATRTSDRLVVKPEKCDAVSLSGDVGDVSLPIDIDLTGQRFVSLNYSSANAFYKATGQMTITGSKELDTKLVGLTPLNLFGKAKMSNIHILGPSLGYALRDKAGYNELSLSNVKMEGKDGLNGQLTLSTMDATATGISGAVTKFENVIVVAEKANPVVLKNYPFDTTGLEIVAGKKYAPHIALQGEYFDTTGVLSETRYPIVTNLELGNNSLLKIGPGVKIKVPTDAYDSAPFHGLNFGLNFAGVPGQHISVTSIKDDSIGGDTNGDGNATSGSSLKLIQTAGNDTENYSLNMHGVDLWGVQIIASRNSKIVMGDVVSRVAQDGTGWRSIVYLYRGSDSRTFPSLVVDGPLDLWHSIETYTVNGELRVSTPIYAASWGATVGEPGATVTGIDLVALHNTSTAATKIESDAKVISNDAGVCNRIYDSSGQITAASKSGVYYVLENVLKHCE